MAGQALYPPPQSLMVNNYPPCLSIWWRRWPGTAMTRSSPGAGCRCWPFSAPAPASPAACARCAATGCAAAFGGLFFAAVLLIDQRLCRHGRSAAAGPCPADGRPAASVARKAARLGRCSLPSAFSSSTICWPCRWRAPLWLIWQDYRAGFSLPALDGGDGAGAADRLPVSFRSRPAGPARLAAALDLRQLSRRGTPSVVGAAAAGRRHRHLAGPRQPVLRCFMAPSRWCWAWALPAAMAWTPMSFSIWRIALAL